MANPALEVGQNPPPIRTPMVEPKTAIGRDERDIQEQLSSVEFLCSTEWAKFFAFLVENSGEPGPPGPSGAASPWVTDTFAASYTADITLGWNHETTATAAIAVNIPSGGSSGQPVLLRIIQDATGGWPISLASGFLKNGTDPGYQEALTSCIINGVFYDATTVLVLSITENIPA